MGSVHDIVCRKRQEEGRIYAFFAVKNYKIYNYQFNKR
ncbi:hypothetical protein CLV24_12027 [Pontibacter ummariensis]|uniref:Uncharacterized protein n=1 Tax=Pontibacter ummariensis TaxID=1610492 RepID=A0A239J3E3_9BACT|nr:hypothetical protein CLV24_12027 [Pontibacter ummariensis]SNT00357.1 hypothetical protein SAMN06296052_12026 [Pontibacter ummariensis]